jgi:ribosomal protein S6
MKETNETSLYEVGYLVMPLLAPEAALEEHEAVKKGIESLGGKITEDGTPKMTGLGYPMPRRIGEKKYNFQDGFFAWVRFELAPVKSLVAKEWLDKRENFLRYLLVTVDEKALLADKAAVEAKLAHREASEAKAEESGEDTPKEAETVLA